MMIFMFTMLYVDLNVCIVDLLLCESHAIFV